MVKINDINDFRIRHYKSLRFTPPSHTNDSVFITESEKVTLKLLTCKIEVVSLFITYDYIEKYKNLIDKKNIPENMIFVAEKNLMEQIVGFKIHNGIMAMGKIPLNCSLDDMKSPIIILNGIIDSENVGSIVRNCAAFGIKSLIVDETSSSPYLRRAVRVSMGNVLDINVYHSDSLIKTLLLLGNKGFSIYAAEITANSKNLDSCKFKEPFALIFGNESAGVATEILQQCDAIIHIPVKESVSSLNVASSSAVFLYEISKRNNNFIFK